MTDNEQSNSASADHASSEDQKQQLDDILISINANTVPATTRATIDLDFLLKDASHELPCAPNEASEDLKNTWVIKATRAYGNAKGQSLIDAFYEDFEGWSSQDFESVHTLLIRALKQHLEAHEVTLPGTNRDKTPTRLVNLMNEDTPQLTLPLPDLERQRSEERVTKWAEDQKSNVRVPSSQSGLLPKTTTRFPVRPQNAPPAQRFPLPPSPNPPEDPTSAPPQEYHTVPPLECANNVIDSAVIKQFAMMWSKANNYTGETYDILDDKVRIFTDICELLRIRYSQLHALFPSILSGRAQAYFLEHMNRGMQYRDMYLAIKQQFDSEINRAQYHTDWSSMTYYTVAAESENAGKSRMEILQTLLDRLQRCQRALGPAFRDEVHLLANTLRAIQGVPELKIALAKPERSFNALSAQLKSTLQVEENTRIPGTFFTDRKYRIQSQRNPNRERSDRSDQRMGDRGRPGPPFADRRRSGPSYPPKDMGCWICKKPDCRASNHPTRRGCWICNKPDCRSTNHPLEEQKRSQEQWERTQKFYGKSTKGFRQFLMSVERPEEVSGSDDGFSDDQDTGDSSSDDRALNEHTAFFLANESFRHRIGGRADKQEPTAPIDCLFLQNQLNSAAVWYGIIPDTGAAAVSTAGRQQTQALQALMPQLQVITGKGISVRFGAGESIFTNEEITVPTPMGTVTFHIVPTDTPFLLCIKDMDELCVYLDNTRDELVKRDGKIVTRIPIFRKWGHPWLFLDHKTHMIADITYMTGTDSDGAVYLTETELRRIHRRFGHPSVDKLWNLLRRADHDVNKDTLELINRFCHYCQIKGNAPQRFKFSLKDEVDFNYEVIVDILTIAGKPVLHAIDASTGFQAATFIPDFSARTTWEALRRCWLDTYLGPPDIITTDAGTNFASTEFKSEARLAGITCHQIPVEAHWSIGKVERYHRPLRRAYEILEAECPGMNPDSLLQAAVKAVNDTAGPNGLVPTLLVFGAMPRITKNSAPSASQVQRAEAVNKAMAELRRINAKRKVEDALNARNGPSTEKVLPRSLELGSEVLVYREKGKWEGPYKVLSVTDTAVTVDMVNGHTEFRSTHVKPYERLVEQENNTPKIDAPEPFIYPEPVLPKRRGRPITRATKPTSPDRRRTAASPQQEQTLPKKRGRPKKIQPQEQPMTDRESSPTQFLVHREQQGYELAVKLRNEGKITTPGKPFEQSDWEEVESLLAAGVIVPIKRSQIPNAKTFGCRLVREVKGLPQAPYEKSRLVVQGYSDREKSSLLTQSPTIMRCSQRLILALTPSLRERGHQLMLRDISQAYTQSDTDLLRDVLLRIPEELRERYPNGTAFRVVKPLYGLAESGLHWFATYQKHHRDRLDCIPTGYDPCLLITKIGTSFGIVGMQTDDTLNLGERTFIKKEDSELVRAGFKAKPAHIIDTSSEGVFNGCIFKVMSDKLTMQQKGQAERLELVNPDSKSCDQQYIAQRARGAYIASTCQPEAAFDFSVAAQAKEPQPDDIERLNKRIQWQIDNAARGLSYVPLDLTATNLYVFVDGSFANNKDLTSQIGYVIVLGNETAHDQEKSFTVRGNIIHWQSVKCKRVTRSVLASEIYGMVGGFDAAYVLKHTLVAITKRLNVPATRMVMCTDSFSLYQCLVQLGTTVEKRLMIDLMALRQSYEERELEEVRWIAGGDNPADAMTKGSPNQALETLVSTNEVTVRVEGWVKRSEKKAEGKTIPLKGASARELKNPKTNPATSTEPAVYASSSSSGGGSGESHHRQSKSRSAAKRPAALRSALDSPSRSPLGSSPAPSSSASNNIPLTTGRHLFIAYTS